MLAFAHVDSFYDRSHILHDVCLDVPDGEVTAVMGRNGTGKTTLMDLISGKTKSTDGRVYLHDTDITNWEEHKIARAGIGRKFQIPSVFKELTVRRNLEVASCGNPGVFANLRFGFGADAERNVDEVLGLIGLSEEQDRIAAYLSHGQTQWLEIGMLLAQEPKLLLVDEPAAGMTDVETHQTAELLKEINRDRTVIVVEHDMAFVRELGVKVTCLHEGTVLAEGTIDQVSSNERVIEVYLGR